MHVVMGCTLFVRVCVCVYLDILKGDDFLTVNLHLLLDGLGSKQTIMNL